MFIGFSMNIQPNISILIGINIKLDLQANTMGNAELDKAKQALHSWTYQSLQPLITFKPKVILNSQGRVNEEGGHHAAPPKLI